MSPRGEGPLTKEIRALSGGEKAQNPYQIISKWCQTLQDPSGGPRKATHQRWGHSGPVGVWPHLSGVSRAHLWWDASCRLSNDGYMGDGGNLNAQNVSLVLYMRGGNIFQRPPLLHL
jgi:hypothetical protein